MLQEQYNVCISISSETIAGRVGGIKHTNMHIDIQQNHTLLVSAVRIRILHARGGVVTVGGGCQKQAKRRAEIRGLLAWRFGGQTAAAVRTLT